LEWKWNQSIAQMVKECPICQMELGAGEEVGRIACDARHQFHFICIATWSNVIFFLFFSFLFFFFSF